MKLAGNVAAEVLAVKSCYPSDSIWALDGFVTVLTSKVEVGQGSRTQITQAAAEELRLPVDRIRLIMADSAQCPDDGGTAGSRTTPSTVPRVRAAAAALRALLTKYSAERLGVAVEQVRLVGGVFEAGDQRLTIAELASDQQLRQRLDVASPGDGASTVPVDKWKVLGTSVAKVDGREVVTGAATYPSDIRRPGMLYGKVLAHGFLRRPAQIRRSDVWRKRSTV